LRRCRKSTTALWRVTGLGSCWPKMRRRQARRSGTGGSFQTAGTPRHQYARVQRLDRPTFLFCIRYVCLFYLCSVHLRQAQCSPWPTPHCRVAVQHPSPPIYAWSRTDASQVGIPNE
ncbi:hypothetical protein KCU98_g19, partial [Aureobasidium melanogenum]